MPDDLSFLDQLEEWIEAQVPPNLHDLPYRMLETMERVSNEIFESLNIHGPPSISIPFPPFSGKEAPPPPPPPPAPLACASYGRAGKLLKAHPYAVGAGAALAVTVGLGLGAAAFRYGPDAFRSFKLKRFGTQGVVEDGMLKEAIVILSPTPMPPILWPLTVSLLRAGYIVLVAVPRVEDAEALEKRLAGLEGRSALRVLIYDPEESTTFPPFHRSLLATLTLRFPSSGKYTGDSYNPQPSHVPHIHAFVSLYPMNPTPPSQPGSLPALPTLLAPNPDGSKPKLITLYPSSAMLTMPDSFASQVLTTNHLLLGRNLAASSSVRIVSVFVGQIDLPHIHSMMLAGGKQVSRRQQAREQLQQASAARKVSIVKDYIFHSVTGLVRAVAGGLGIGSYGRDYATFERRFLCILKNRHRREYAVGQYSYMSLALSRVPLSILPGIISILPALPGPTGPLSANVQGLPAPRKMIGSRNTASASSSDHEGGEDLASSIHTTHTQTSSSSRGAADSESSATGLEGSWVGLEAGN